MKALPRAGWVRVGVRDSESVAAHSWGVAWLVLVLAPEEIDRAHAIAIAIVHDLAEVHTGDITPADGISKSEKRRRESEAMLSLTEGLPNGLELLGLWKEYADQKTAEAIFVRACDKLDMALQASIYRTPERDLDEFVASALSGIEIPLLRALAGDCV